VDFPFTPGAGPSSWADIFWAIGTFGVAIVGSMLWLVWREKRSAGRASSLTGRSDSALADDSSKSSNVRARR
jgi:hypothetical protein